MTPLDQLKREEETRRERNWDPRLKWKVLQSTIAWADRQHNVRRNTREACLREQRRKACRASGSSLPSSAG